MKFLSSLSKKQLAGKTVLVRLDLNVEASDSAHSIRIQRAIETIQFLRSRGARVVVVSHRGRPQPLVEAMTNDQFPIPKISKGETLRMFKNVFQKVLKEKVTFFDYFDFKKIKEEIAQNDNGIFLLENIRLLAGEERNSKTLAKQLASLADMYVNDAFAVSHRAHASVAAITSYIPSYAGIELEQELHALSRALQKTDKPLVVILGGAKISDKIGVIRSFAKADAIVTGGGIANTLFAAQGKYIGDSLYEKGVAVKNIIRMKNVFLPLDPVWSERKILDAGPATAKEYGDIMKAARMVVWNGPLGLTEQKRFSQGTKVVWNALCAFGARAVVGGGETTSFIESIATPVQRASKRIFLSIGGGAMLEYLSGKKLPGIEALERK